MEELLNNISKLVSDYEASNDECVLGVYVSEFVSTEIDPFNSVIYEYNGEKFEVNNHINISTK